MKEKNKMEVSIELVGADEVIQKLQEIKKLLNDIAIISPRELIRRNIDKTETEENKSLYDLRQKLINYLYELLFYDDRDIELLKILFNEFK